MSFVLHLIQQHGGAVGIWLSQMLMINQYLAATDGEYWDLVEKYGVWFIIAPTVLLIVYFAMVFSANFGSKGGTLGFLLGEVNMRRTIRFKLWLAAVVFVTFAGLFAGFLMDLLDHGFDLDTPGVLDMLYKLAVILACVVVLFPTHPPLEISVLRRSELPVRVKAAKFQSSSDVIIDLQMAIIAFGRPPDKDNADTEKLQKLFVDLNDDEVRVIAYNLIKMFQQ